MAKLKGKYGKKFDDNVAYTPLTEKEKHEKMEDLIRRLNDPKDPTGNYRSPGKRYNTKFQEV